MGGCGSGQYHRGHVKSKVENYRSLDANSFAKWGNFKSGSKQQSKILWWRQDRKPSSCSYDVNINGIDDSIIFSYEYGDRTYSDVKVRLCWYSPGYGGRRYLFVCPYCRRHMRTLLFKHGELACRICHNLTYTSCVENKRFDSLYKLMAVGEEATWLDFKRRINYLSRTANKKPKRPRGRPRKQQAA